ncbi:hypothetical protein HPB50_029115 [Hyalomma asiaticum]|nr:hypothetical protein HPB50_029115 [Hyalomma asiaticum]
MLLALLTRPAGGGETLGFVSPGSMASSCTAASTSCRKAHMRLPRNGAALVAGAPVVGRCLDLERLRERERPLERCRKLLSAEFICKSQRPPAIELASSLGVNTRPWESNAIAL